MIVSIRNFDQITVHSILIKGNAENNSQQKNIRRSTFMKNGAGY